MPINPDASYITSGATHCGAEDSNLPRPSLSSLDTDVVLNIFIYISVRDILAIRQTSRHFLAITHLRTVWHAALITKVLSGDLPAPGFAWLSPSRNIDALSNLSGPALERLTRRATTYHENWTSASPVPRRRRMLVAAPATSVVRLCFLPGHRHLLSYGYTKYEVGTRGHCIQIWDLDVEGTSCVAEFRFDREKGQRVYGLALNSLQDVGEVSPRGTFSFSVKSNVNSRIDIVQFDPSQKDKEDRLQIIQTSNRHGPSLAFHGKLLVVMVISDSAVTVRDWRSGYEVQLLHQGPQDEQCLGAHITRNGKNVIVFYERSIQIYAVSEPFPPMEQTTPPLDIRPALVLDQIFKINSIVCSELISWIQDPKVPSPLSLLVRFDSLFPWPGNVIHHFVLAPDPVYCHATDAHSDTHLREGRTPYTLPPVLLHSLPSPVRLFGRSDMTMGSYGTALWVDSDADGEMVASVVGERIAGRRLVVPPDISSIIANSGLKPPVNQQHMGFFNSSNFTLPESTLVGLSEQGARSSVFSTTPTDGWTTLALDEEMGRIAVAKTGGFIEVWEYA
ncbi:hypothetical protein BD410DRAFT_528963 [Rickenella mellea]|uniref:F-box domain-containing protein n=1 Tax=Rickenella mellea TaxID=50990 RepID=A0A4Y7QHC3_9AGAM|nr:hypothetical protein BD410DRAFT_528963 [Rickenella mellea]